jgi:hypothetical protein
MLGFCELNLSSLFVSLLKYFNARDNLALYNG